MKQCIVLGASVGVLSFLLALAAPGVMADTTPSVSGGPGRSWRSPNANRNVADEGRRASRPVTRPDYTGGPGDSWQHFAGSHYASRHARHASERENEVPAYSGGPGRTWRGGANTR